MDRRKFVQAVGASAASFAWPSRGAATAAAAANLARVNAEIDKRSGEAIARLQAWVRQPSIASENRLAAATTPTRPLRTRR